MLRQKLKRKLITVCSMILLVISAAAVSARFIGANQTPLDHLVSNNDEVVSLIRGALSRNSSCITVQFNTDGDIRPRLLELADMWVNSAMQETDSPVEGDYIPENRKRKLQDYMTGMYSRAAENPSPVGAYAPQR